MRHRFRVLLLIASAGATVAAAPAARALSVLAHTRSALAFGELVEGGVPRLDTQQSSATDDAPFAAEAAATVRSGVHVAGAEASQDSRFHVSGHRLTVDAAGAGVGFFGLENLPKADSAVGEGTSYFELVFQVDVTSTWSLTGFVGADLERRERLTTDAVVTAVGEGEIRFRDDTGSVVHQSRVVDPVADLVSEEEVVRASGLLAPGVYTLEGWALGTAEGSGGAAGSGAGSFAIDLEVSPVPEASTLVLVAVSVLAGAARWRRASGLAACGERG